MTCLCGDRFNESDTNFTTCTMPLSLPLNQISVLLIALELVKAWKYQNYLTDTKQRILFYANDGAGWNGEHFGLNRLILLSFKVILLKTFQYDEFKNTENRLILGKSYRCGYMNQTQSKFCFKSLKSVESPERKLAWAVFSRSWTICCVESWIRLKAV